jgi:hypothetical protein
MVDASGPLHLPTTTSVRAAPRKHVTKRALEAGTVCATVDVKARLLILTYVSISGYEIATGCPADLSLVRLLLSDGCRGQSLANLEDLHMI